MDTDSPENDTCGAYVPSTMVPAIPEVATDVPGTGTLPTRGGGVKTSGAADNALGLEVLLIGVVLVSSGGKRRRVNSSITQLIQYSWREGCGSTAWSCA